MTPPREMRSVEWAQTWVNEALESAAQEADKFPCAADSGCKDGDHDPWCPQAIAQRIRAKKSGAAPPVATLPRTLCQQH